MKHNDNLKSFFENQDWDIASPPPGHEVRFLHKIEKKNTLNPRLLYSIAALLVVFIGSLLLFLWISNTSSPILSTETQNTEDYFSAVLEKEILQLKDKENPSNKKIIQDAIIQLDVLENDYIKLKLEIQKNGENKQLIHALLTNMQTRISFIQSVMEQTEKINQIQKNTYENNM